MGTSLCRLIEEGQRAFYCPTPASVGYGVDFVEDEQRESGQSVVGISSEKIGETLGSHDFDGGRLKQ
jgi:hypothetical protein